MICCPYCLENVKPKLVQKENKTVYVCPNEKCQMELPRDLQQSPLRIGLVGFSGHGKTVYLTSLFYTLRILREKSTWGETFFWLASDQSTVETVYKHVEAFRKSKLPEGTPENFPKPALFQFNEIPLFGNCFLSFYDTAGRVYEDVEKITDMGRFVSRSNVVLFIVSLMDCGGIWGSTMESLGDSWGSTMEYLLEIYINAAYNKLNVDLKQQHLIVVLTKGDIIDGLPQDIKSFLFEGSYKRYGPENGASAAQYMQATMHMQATMQQLRGLSNRLKQWLESKRCRGFTKLAADRFKSVEYTVVSATGAAPVGGRLVSELKPEDPKRVLDPLLWALEKSTAGQSLMEPQCAGRQGRTPSHLEQSTARQSPRRHWWRIWW